MIFEITKIDKWFLAKFQKLADMELGWPAATTAKRPIKSERNGLLDKTIRRLTGKRNPKSNAGGLFDGGYLCSGVYC